jgi:hypothetical protein
MNSQLLGIAAASPCIPAGGCSHHIKWHLIWTLSLHMQQLILVDNFLSDFLY